MNEGVRITIEEWAGDNGLDLTDELVAELADGIDTAYQMSMPCGYGVDRYESENKKEIRRLENQIDMLMRYLDSKGLHCILHDDHISRTFFINWGGLVSSQREEFR